MNKIFAFLVICALIGFVLPNGLLAQEVDEQKITILEQRVATLEDYVQKLQTALNDFSKKLTEQMERQITAYSNQTVVLNPYSQKFTKIETNTGMFLLSVSKIEKIQDGYRLILSVGNTSNASFSDVILRLRWGKKWDPSFVKPTYKEWRRSLKEGTYAYNGTLAPGVFSEVIVDIIPAGVEDKEYIECEIEAGSLKLHKNS